MRHDRATNLALLATAAVIYGGIFPVNRLAGEAGWPPLGFDLAQSTLAGAVMAAYVVARGRSLLPSRRQGAVYLLLGTLAMALPTALLAWAARHVPASTLTLVLPLSPVFTMLFAILMRLEPFRPRVLAAVLLGLVGVGLIALPGSQGLPEGALPWFLLALLAPLSFAAGNVATGLLRPPATASTTMASGILLGGALVLAAALLPTDPAVLPPLLDARAARALGFASLIDAVTFVLFFEIVRRAGATFFSLFNYLVIVAGVAWSMLLYAESPPPVFWLALAVLVASVATAVGGRSVPAAA